MKLSTPTFLVSMLALSSASAYDTSVHCTTLGKVQNATNDDITKGLSAWFGNSSVGSSCTQPANTSQFCPAAGQPETDCYLQAAYNVWDNSMSCESYYQLQQQVQDVCGLGGGYTDCGCAVVSGKGSNKCLLASFVYHASGLAVESDDGAVTPYQPTFEYGQTPNTSRRLRRKVKTDPYPESYNPEGEPTVWTVNYLGSCSSVSSDLTTGLSNVSNVSDATTKVSNGFVAARR